MALAHGHPYRPVVYCMMWLFSGNTTFGVNVLASSKSIRAYDIIITVSPTCTLRAAAPLRE